MGVFVSSRFGFQELTGDEAEFGSLNDITIKLGYNPDQTYLYFGDHNQNYQVQSATVEVFSGKIIFVLADSTKGSLKKGKVDYFMRDFNAKNIFDGPTVADILRCGIDNKSLNINFLSEVLKIKSPALNGVFHVDSIGLNLIFESGFLTEFSPSDGLNQWGKLWKQLNPTLTDDYEKQAMKYWGTDSGSIIREVNAQAEAFANTPGGFDSEFVILHRTEYGLIDFCMLMVCHHNLPITHSEFVVLNHSRYNTLNSVGNSKKYRLQNFIYEFSDAGHLMNVHQLREY